MRILFCSNSYGQNGTTTNMLSAAVLTDILYDKQSLIFQAKPDKHSFYLPLINPKKENQTAFDEIEKSQRIGFFLNSGCSKELFNGCSISLPDSSISYIPFGTVLEEEAYMDRFIKWFQKLLSIAEDFYEMLFIDAGVMPDPLMDILYAEADIIAVCLNQNKQVLDDFFYHGRKDNKMIYIIGMYDKDSIHTKEQLLRHYGELHCNNTFIMPYNIQVRDAVSASNLFSFFYQNIGCEKQEQNYEFMQSALKLTRHLNR